MYFCVDMDKAIALKMTAWAQKYNDRKYFATDPINFPRRFADALQNGVPVMGKPASELCLADVEIAGLFASHLAWGRRSMIVNDCGRLFEQMHWQPYNYVMEGRWRDDSASVHRTIKWCEIAAICKRLKDIYSHTASIEQMSVRQIRTDIFGAKDDPGAANKKINMFRRWMVRDDGKVDLGVWHGISKRDLLIPLDVHVFNSATMLGLTCRKSADCKTVLEITGALREIFPEDPCLGDFALFGYGVSSGE